jgi:hypothetical protein
MGTVKLKINNYLTNRPFLMRVVTSSYASETARGCNFKQTV